MRAFHEVKDYPDGFMVRREQYENIRISAHWHREIELIRINTGCAVFHVPGEAIRAQAGDLILCDSGDIHYCDVYSEDCIMEAVIFDPAVIGSGYCHLSLEDHCVKARTLAETELDKRWNELLAGIDAGKFRYGELRNEVITADLQALWYRVVLLCPQRTGSEELLGRRRGMLDRFRRVLDYIEENYQQDISMADAAAMTGVSFGYFSKLFKQFTGEGFCRYVNKVRIGAAQDMLLQTDKSITDIAFLCGYANVRSFNRMFLDITGCTPSGYEKKPHRRQHTDYFKSTSALKTQEEMEAGADRP